MNEKWEDCLHRFRDNLSPEQFEAWFKPITFLNFEDDTLTVGVPSEYFKEHLETHYLKLLGFTLRRVYGPNVKLRYKFRIVKNEPDTTVTMSGSNSSTAINDRARAANPFRAAAAAEDAEIDSQLNPRYNFNNYCVGECN
ncbi:MAG: chromosomal replication initiator protein DnaA, partial [Muribaculaceae bacterium]|nr:chromosomal replication initiator protein DnaA [Muribaculaceae bacterium]